MGIHFLSSPLTTLTDREMRVLEAAAGLMVLVASVSPAPQFGGLKSLVKSLTGDDKPGEVNGDYEQVPYTVLAKYNGYEERNYPSVNYACTEMTYDAPDDEDSEEWGLERAIKWMTNKKSWKDRPQSKMFMRLFRYIAGVNKESQEIEMTVPVWSKMVVSQVRFVLSRENNNTMYPRHSRTERSPKICASTLPKSSSPTLQNPWTLRSKL